MAKLFLLDGMALVYRAHFALLQRPVVTSAGVNTSALYGFTQTLLELVNTHAPTHLAVAFDTEAPTPRHTLFPEYKAQRQAMPEELSLAIPAVHRMVAGFRIPVLTLDGYEADDIIGTLVRRADAQGVESYMVTPDKDFAQLVTERTWLYKPGRFGSGPEVLGVEGVRQRWGIQEPRQVMDLLGLMGDASDNIPGVPGIGEKTAAKLITEFGSIENLYAQLDRVKGKLRETLAAHREQAFLSKQLATIDCQVPLGVELDTLAVRPRDDDALRALCVEFEFNSIGRRLFGDSFVAGRGVRATSAPPAVWAASPRAAAAAAAVVSPGVPVAGAELRSLQNVAHEYRVVRTETELAGLERRLGAEQPVGMVAAVQGADPRRGGLQGLAVCTAPHEGWFVPAGPWVERLAARLAVHPGPKVSTDAKALLAVCRASGVCVGEVTGDVLLAHALIEPELRHHLGYVAESRLGYRILGATEGGQGQGELGLDATPPDQMAEAAMEQADLAVQLWPWAESQLRERNQARIFSEVEMPLVPVLVAMEAEGIRVDAAALAEFSGQLQRTMGEQERATHQLAGGEFNVGSPRQLGEVLFERLRLSDHPRRTASGQYATDEQTLMALSGQHEIVERLFAYRACSKLKSTYADALPTAIDPRTGRVHTTYLQLATATGRLSSFNPNLQNIPIRTELGQEIRKAFVPRGPEYQLLSADYSQIELRILASLSREAGLMDALRSGEDVHTATAARVFDVAAEAVTSEMRKRAKMVNYGIAYGISAFGLAQRLAIPRKEAASIIEHYFARFPGIRRYMTETVAMAREQGYAQTVLGRRRYLRDIGSANATVRAAAERNAINAPIQGTAADMIKIAMVGIHRALVTRGYRTRLLLQVHDELVFDLHREEAAEVVPLVKAEMRRALTLEVPVVVDTGVGANWLEAH